MPARWSLLLYAFQHDRYLDGASLAAPGEHGHDARTQPQAAMFVNDATVSKGMVKYAQQLARESILDISGPVSIPEKPVEKCTQKAVRARAACSLRGLWRLGGLNIPAHCMQFRTGLLAHTSNSYSCM